VLLRLAATPVAAAGEGGGDIKSTPERPRVVRIGAVAYAPSAVTIFEHIRRYFDRRGMPVDHVLFSHYESLVEAPRRDEVDIAWNTPLAHAQ
jgi:ABC-type phosphate/phosphonate transport system substrate-binding protein